MKIKLLTLILTGLIMSFATYGQEQKSNILIEKGLAYLASVQSTSKGMEDLSGPSINPTSIVPEETKIPGHWQSNVGISALCLQAFVSNGHGVNDPLYGTTVTNAITYILGQQITSGYHMGAFNQTTYGYGTAMAIVALKAAYNNAGLVEPLKSQVQTALDLALNYYTQDINEAWTQVSWRYDRGYTSPLNGDMSCNQWAYLALNEMDYTDKDVWNKIYGYINTRKATSGNMAYIGYQSAGTWTRGNTCAGVWGLILANQHGVAGAGALSQQMYNYLEQYSLTELFNPASIGTHVYDGGGYYYYVYELSKALSLGNKTNFAGGAWYDHLYNRIDGQKLTDGSGNYYWNGWGGQGIPMETALALLSLQTGTVPPGSKLTISLDTDPGKDDCIEFSIFDEFGNEAKINSTTFYTNIAQSEWTSTSGDYWEWLKLLQTAGNYNVQIKNLCPVEKQVELCFKVYTLEDVLVDEECFMITNDPYKTIAATGFVNAIGGLNVIIINPPAEIPIMELAPPAIGFNPFEYSETYNFTFDVLETGNEEPLLNIDLFASDLIDEFGNIIPANSFSLIPSTINVIAPGGSVEVSGTLITPASFTKDDIGLFQGVITAQTNQQAKAINFEIGKPTMSVNPDVIDFGYLAGSTSFDISFSGYFGADWTLDFDAPWITTSTIGGSGNGSVGVDFEGNNSGFDRTAVITVLSPNSINPELTVTINQTASPFPFFIEADLIVSTDKASWESAEGNLADGFIVGLDALIEYYYLDLGPNTQTNVPLMNDYFPFYLDVNNLPGGFYPYWANRGVFEGCTGVWEPIMWQIISGELPTFYIRYEEDGKVYPFMLVDGLQKLLGQPDDYLRVNGVYPFGTYNYTGFIQDVAGNLSDEVLVKITFTSDFYQEIELPAGWLGISSFIVPENPDVEIMLAGIEDYMEIILRFGGFYWPPQNINMFGDWNAYEGYKIKLNEGALLEIFGGPAETTVSFPAGLHYLPVLTPAAIDADEVLGDVGDALLFAFNIQDGLIYWPMGGLATLETLEPGIGYLIRLLEPATFEFAGKTISNPQSPTTMINETIWNDVVNTGNPHIISVSASALTSLEVGDVVGVFDAQGTCVGMSNYEGVEGNLALIAYGDDFTTASRDGLDEGASLQFRLYRPSTGQQADLLPVFDPTYNTGTFENGGISIVNSLKVQSLTTENQTGNEFSIYPNPSEGVFNVVASVFADVKVLDAKGQIVYSGQINGNTQLDLSMLSKGVYYLKISNNDFSNIQKLIIN